jgi:hypothetical protein
MCYIKSFIQLLLLLSTLAGPLSAAQVSYIGINPFIITIADSSPYKNFHTKLHRRLQYELLPHGIKPVIIDSIKPEECVTVANGTIELTEENQPILRFELSGLMTSGEETKTIPLQNRTIDEVLDLLALKIRNFLEQNISGKLRISSTPLNCNIQLNGLSIGTTPAELTLERGLYTVKIQRDHLLAYTDTIEILSGKETSLQAAMKFEGSNVKPWVIGATAVTVCTIVSWIIESSLHNTYKNLEKGLPQSVYDNHYKPYQTTNYVRISLLNASILGWTISGFQIARNKTLEKTIFER